MIEHPSTLPPSNGPQLVIPGIGVSLQDRIDEAIDLLRTHEHEALKLSPHGYYLAFSGGKDSQVIKKLAEMAGVKFSAHYSQTTIDPPELVRFLKAEYGDVQWLRPPVALLKVVEDKGPPNRLLRWCCEMFKESGGDGRIKILGVRAEESPRRKARWTPISQWRGKQLGIAVCPIVHWSKGEIWEFINRFIGNHCCLYDEGWERLGCIGCPMAGEKRIEEFRRWPGFGKAWERSVHTYWHKHQGLLNRFGDPYTLAQFKTPQALWGWWLSEKPTPQEDEECLGLFDAA